jgi:hypothetical protein
MQRFNNWMSYSFGGVEYGPKRFSQDVLKIHFNKKYLESYLATKMH